MCRSGGEEVEEDKEEEEEAREEKAELGAKGLREAIALQEMEMTLYMLANAFN